MSTAQAYVSGPVAVSHGDRIIGSRDLVLLFLAVAACCGSFVFALLYNSDQGYHVAAIQQQTPPPPTQPRPLVPSPQPTPSAPAHIDFTLHRSNSFQTVGPIRLGIWRIDSRHDSVRASILVSHRRINLNRIALNERVVIPASPSQTFELVISRVSKNEIAGYLSEPKRSDSETRPNSGSGTSQNR